MIAGLIGSVYKKNLSNVLFNVNGVIYEVNMSLNSLSQIKENDTLLITQIIREDSNSLYGFLQKAEKDLFDNLIKISGIGPKAALSICSAFSPNDFLTIMNNNDFNKLKEVQGIGEKTAKRILVEMSGKITQIDAHPQSLAKKEALNALEALGFKRNAILKVLENIDSQNTEMIIKEALQKLSK